MTDDQFKLLLFTLKQIEANTRRTQEGVERVAEAFEAEVAELKVPRL